MELEWKVSQKEAGHFSESLNKRKSKQTACDSIIYVYAFYFDQNTAALVDRASTIVDQVKRKTFSWNMPLTICIKESK